MAGQGLAGQDIVRPAHARLLNKSKSINSEGDRDVLQDSENFPELP